MSTAAAVVARGEGAAAAAAPPATPNSARVRDSPKAAIIRPKRDTADDILQQRKSTTQQEDGAASSNNNTTTANTSTPYQSSPSGSTHRRANMLRSSAAANAEAESSADEETSIFHKKSSGQNTPNYQSTAQKPPAALRSRPSTTSIRRSGRIYQPGEHGNNEQPGEEEHEHESWWARMLSEYGSIELENKGSVARDHLALERTFLAWLRTSLAFASIGIAITQLFRLNVSALDGPEQSYQRLRHIGKPLGATFLGISIVMLGIGFHRYFESQHWIIRGKFPASRGSVALVAFVTFALMVTSLTVVVAVEPRAFET